MELFDLYDINRVKTGKIVKRGDRIPDGYYRLVVHVCIFNSKGEMLIQQRSNNKKWPNKWDISVGGCVQRGETSQMAIAREVYEEIGYRIDFTNLRPVFTFNFDEGYDDFYLITADLDLTKVTLQKEEVQNVKWASVLEIIEKLKNGEFILYHESMINFLFDIRNNLDIYKE